MRKQVLLKNGNDKKKENAEVRTNAAELNEELARKKKKTTIKNRSTARRR